MKDGKFESTIDVLKTLTSGGSIGCSNEVFKLDEQGNMTINGRVVYNFHLYNPSSYHLVPSPAYYIPKDNSFAYYLIDGECQKLVCFDSTEIIGRTSIKADISQLIPCTKEQAERRVNSWWKHKLNPRRYRKIENGKAYSREVGAKLWYEFKGTPRETSIDLGYQDIEKFDPITRAECETAFRETFDFATAIKHVMDGKTVCRNVCGGDCSIIHLKRCAKSIGWKSADEPETGWRDFAIMTNEDIDAQYWLAE